MPDKVNITSVEALDDFRAKLVIYLSKARPTLEEVAADVTRTRVWLENDQRIHWENQVRRRTKVLEQAQQALFSSRVSALREASGAEQMAVQRAKRSLDEAAAKLQVLKKWNREFASQVEPLVKQLDKLHTFLSHDMLKAIAYLTQQVKTLDDYAGLTPASASVTPPPPPSGEAAAGEPATPAPAPASADAPTGGTP